MATEDDRGRYSKAPKFGFTASGTIFYGSREPYRISDYPDSSIYEVQAGDTLQILAERVFEDASYWWVIADFQEPPILDSTLRLRPATVLLLPPSRVLNAIFSASRNDRIALLDEGSDQ